MKTLQCHPNRVWLGWILGRLAHLRPLRSPGPRGPSAALLRAPRWLPLLIADSQGFDALGEQRDHLSQQGKNWASELEEIPLHELDTGQEADYLSPLGASLCSQADLLSESLNYVNPVTLSLLGRNGLHRLLSL